MDDGHGRTALDGERRGNYLAARYIVRKLTEPDDIDYRALAELRHQIRRFLTFSEQQARAEGLEPQQHQLLLAVKGLPEGARPTLSTLADRLRLRHHTVVGLVDRLVAAKLAVRRRSPIDRREILVELTARGERVLRKLSVLHREELRSAAPALLAALQAIVGKRPDRKGSARRGPVAGRP